MKNLITKNSKFGVQLASCMGLLVIGGGLMLGGVANAASLKTKDTASGSPSTSTTSSPTPTTAAGSSTTGSNTTASTSSKKAAAQQARVQNIITKGDQEIERRLTTLGDLTDKINAATHLSSSDKSYLSSEVSSTLDGLTSLKSHLDSDTTLTSAHTDAESIYTNYRVYALVAPKIGIIKVADDQQTVEAKLSALIPKLQDRISSEQKAGTSVTAIQGELSDMTTKVNDSQAISSQIESTVLTLQPTDYNTNHTVLSGDNTQLKTAHTDNQAAVMDAKNILSALKSSKS
jgi:hypothetical protein